ncbi:nucleotidyltransferase family protein [Paracoccus subflavus]|nr:nucleotidyltransferase family protein [Paracoccus subflavus]
MRPLMIFAAGLGTRMRPLTDTLPKPLIPVAGRTLLDRALDLGRDAGAGPVVVNTHHLGNRIAAHLAGRNVAISDEQGTILDTGGGLRQALPLLGRGPKDKSGPVMTLNPDVVWTGPNPLAALNAAWRDDMDVLLMLVPLDRATARQGAGDFSLDGAGRIARGGDLVYGGAQIVRPDRLADIPDRVFSLNRLWDLLIAQGRAHGIVHPGGWCDVGYPAAIPLAEGMLHG